MSPAQLRASLTTWTSREKVRKQLHTIAQRDLDKARASNTHPRQHLVDRRDKRAQQLAQARNMITRRRRQLTEHASVKPRIITASQLGLSFQWVWGDKGGVYRGAGHYTAGPRAKTATDLVQLARTYHQAHAAKGWGGISYEALIADDGTICLLNPAARKSAAVASNNTGMINVCVPGTTGDRITPAAAASIRWLLANWHTTKAPKAHRMSRRVRASDIDWRVHREHPDQSTQCPGDMTSQYRSLFS